MNLGEVYANAYIVIYWQFYCIKNILSNSGELAMLDYNVLLLSFTYMTF